MKQLPLCIMKSANLKRLSYVIRVRFFLQKTRKGLFWPFPLILDGYPKFSFGFITAHEHHLKIDQTKDHPVRFCFKILISFKKVNRVMPYFIWSDWTGPHRKEIFFILVIVTWNNSPIKFFLVLLHKSRRTSENYRSDECNRRSQSLDV